VAPDVTTTSLNSPLRIADVAFGAGCIGITLCPGKIDPQAMTGPCVRDLDVDVAAIATWGARAVLTLLEDDEMVLLHVTALGETLVRHGMEWFHLPILDCSIPDAAFEERWTTVGPHLEEIVREGGRVAVHCRGGLGRSGTVAAMMLVQLGVSAADAIARVRAARPGAIETPEQEEFVRDAA
jgi:ADP-ribosyl-[dinitrogen reductase] hydrolase